MPAILAGTLPLFASTETSCVEVPREPHQAAPGYSYAVLSGSLPTSTSLNTSTGVISGTPTVAGTYTFTIKVTVSSGNVGTQNFSITISAPASSGGGAFTFLS